MNIYKYIVDKYNHDYDTSLTICEDVQFRLPRIDCDNNIITVNRSTVLQLVLYYYSTPDMCHLYRLIYGLYEYGYYDECQELLEVFENSFDSSRDELEHYVLTDPQWITTQMLFIILHELAHYSMHRDNEFLKLQLDLCKTKLKTQDFLIGNQLIKLLYKPYIRKYISDEMILEEFGADLFAFNYLSSAIFDVGCHESLNAILCATSMGSVFFLEYISRIERLYFNPPSSNNFKRMYNNYKREWEYSVQNRIRVLLMDKTIREFWKTYPVGDSYCLYNSLLAPIVERCNQSINVDLHRFVTPYYRLLRVGGKVNFDFETKNKIDERIKRFDTHMLSLLNKALKEHNCEYCV